MDKKVETTCDSCGHKWQMPKSTFEGYLKYEMTFHCHKCEEIKHQLYKVSWDYNGNSEPVAKVGDIEIKNYFFEVGGAKRRGERVVRCNLDEGWYETLRLDEDGEAIPVYDSFGNIESAEVDRRQLSGKVFIYDKSFLHSERQVLFEFSFDEDYSCHGCGKQVWACVCKPQWKE